MKLLLFLLEILMFFGMTLSLSVREAEKQAKMLKSTNVLDYNNTEDDYLKSLVDHQSLRS